MATNNVLNAPIPFAATKGGTGLVSPTIHGVLIAQGASPVTPLVLAAGQVLIGTTASDPAAAALTAGTGISIVSATGAITISSTVAAFSWAQVAGTSQTLAANIGYVAMNAALTTFTLPATAALGDTFIVYGTTAAGWSVVPGTATQSVRFGAATITPSTGSISSTAIGDAIELVCIDDTVPGSEAFGVVPGAVGNLTVV